MLPLLFAAPPAAAAVPTGERPSPDETDEHPRERTGIAFGVALGAGMGAASGYPNNSTQIGDPNYYSASGLMVGTSETFMAMGALADYLNFGFWFAHADFRSKDWRSIGNGGGFRVEAFPLLRLYPRLGGLGLLAQFGLGSGNLRSTQPGLPEAEGTQSFVAAGAFYEWAVGHVLGGHFGVGPSLEYDAIFSQPFERNTVVATARVVFYGGP